MPSEREKHFITEVPNPLGVVGCVRLLPHCRGAKADVPVQVTAFNFPVAVSLPLVL